MVSMSPLPLEVVRLFQHVACEACDDATWAYAPVRGCVRRGVWGERAAERGRGHLGRGEGAHLVRPCALLGDVCGRNFPNF